MRTWKRVRVLLLLLPGLILIGCQRHVTLRNTPQIVSDWDSQKAFDMTIGGRPRHYIANRFQDLGEIVRDDTTGLMWQKSWGSSIRYTETQHYIQQLNHQQFAGYADWRLPTIPELLSIVEPEKHESGLYINPIFTPAASYHWCWSADTRLNDDDSELTVWYVIFRFGNVHWDTMKNIGYVLAVRSM